MPRKLIILSRSESKDLKSCYTADELDGMEDEEEVGNVGSEHENVRQDGNCEDNEADTDDRIGEESKPGEAGE
jgi:hypothetical protein